MDNERVLRFSKVERLAHWVNAGAFFILLLTGLIVFSPFFSFLAPVFGGVQGARIVHRVVAVIFAFGSLSLLVFGDWNAFRIWIKEITTWGKDDIKFLQEFPKEFFGKEPQLPEQGRFNSGEKVNSLLVLSGSTLLVLTGFGMWFADSMPLWLVRLCYPLHDLAAFLMFSAVLGHMYLGLLHPSSKEAINGMISGTVTRKFAQEHHGRWYRETMQKERSS